MNKLNKNDLKILKTFFTNVKQQLDGARVSRKVIENKIKERYGIGYIQLSNIVQSLENSQISSKAVNKNIKTFIENVHKLFKDWNSDNEERESILRRYKIKLDRFNEISLKLGINEELVNYEWVGCCK